jgi:hypothetical protein
MQKDFALTIKRIADAFEAEFNLPPEVCRDIGFHMADWLDEYEQLGRVFDMSQNLSNEEIQEIIGRFLIHAPHHINAAKKLSGYGPTEDVFGVGIFEEDEFEEIEGDEE